MSDQRERDLRHAREDNRNELAKMSRFAAELEAHETELRRVENDRWMRKIQACLPVVDPQPCDFPGCVE